MKIFLKTLVVILMLIPGISKAQFIQENQRVADTYFENKEYYAAAQFYLKALNKAVNDSISILPYPIERSTKGKEKERMKDTEDTEYLLFRLGESYRLYRNFTEAEKVYRRILNSNNPNYKLVPFWYAESLRSNKKYTEAISAFENFIKSYKENDEYKKSAQSEVQSCRYALVEMNFPRLVKVQKLSGNVNHLGSNYAPFQTANTFYFTSSRPSGNIIKKKILYTDNALRLTQKNDPYLNAIYSVSDFNANATSEIKKLDLPVSSTEFAASTFSSDGKYMFYTAWSEKKSIKQYQIYRSELDSFGKWSEGILMESQINMSGYNSKQPSLSSDGKYLIFSSDRPGGSGKYDLWYCTISADGKAGQAINLGPQINSAGDDEAAYYHAASSKLIFSTNGRIGIGGFDFFQSAGSFGSWSEPLNMGYPFNSSKDDIYFSPSNASASEGYISSDRESECCLELFSVNIGKLGIAGDLNDCDSGLPLKGARVIMTDIMSGKSREVYTNDKGKFRFEIYSRRPFKIAAEKDEYFSKTINYNINDFATADTLFSSKLCLTAYKVNVPIVLKEVFYDFNSAELTNPSKLILDNLYKIMSDNPKINIELSAHTDSIGSDNYNMELSQRRAQSCVDYLLSKNISLERLTARGYGKTMPVAPNSFPDGSDNPGGRQLNRRTEFKVLKD